MQMNGEVIRVEREKRGLSQDDLGQLVGVQQSAISRLENSERVPSFATLIKLAEVLELSIDSLVLPNAEGSEQQPTI